MKGGWFEVCSGCVSNLPKITSTYLDAIKIPDSAMPLVRAVAEWTARGDIPNAATDAGTLPQNGYISNRESENLRNSVYEGEYISAIRRVGRLAEFSGA